MKSCIREAYLEEVGLQLQDESGSREEGVGRAFQAEEAAEGRGWHFSRACGGEMERWSPEGSGPGPKDLENHSEECRSCFRKSK